MTTVTMTTQNFPCILQNLQLLCEYLQLILPFLTRVSRIILYIVNKTLREMGLNPQRASETPRKQLNKRLIGVETHKSVHLWVGMATQGSCSAALFEIATQ